MLHSSKIVYFESCDNCGKTSLIEEVEKRLTQQGLRVSVVRQPGSTNLGKSIYELHHDYENVQMNGFSRQLLHVAAHLQFYKEFRQEYDVVLFDRSFLSCMAYAHAYPSEESARDFEVRAIFDLETYYLPSSLCPSLTVYLTNPPHTNDANPKYEGYEKVREAYSTLWKLPYLKAFLEKRPVYAVNNASGKMEASISTIMDLILKVV